MEELSLAPARVLYGERACEIIHQGSTVQYGTGTYMGRGDLDLAGVQSFTIFKTTTTTTTTAKKKNSKRGRRVDSHAALLTDPDLRHDKRQTG